MIPKIYYITKCLWTPDPHANLCRPMADLALSHFRKGVLLGFEVWFCGFVLVPPQEI